MNSASELAQSNLKLGSYKIFSLRCQDFQLEFAPVRLEFFNDSISHKNFTCSFHTNLTTQDSFKRRDFTINAIGMTAIKRKAWIDDPYGGINDLEKKLLKACNELNFSRDPVRFIRAIRFKIKFDLNYDQRLHQILQQMDINSLTAYYLRYEWSKSESFENFISECLSFENFKQMFQRRFGRYRLKDIKTSNFEAFLYRMAISVEQSDEFASFFTLKKNLLKSLIFIWNIDDDSFYYESMDNIKMALSHCDKIKSLFGDFLNTQRKNLMLLKHEIANIDVDLSHVEANGRQDFLIKNALKKIKNEN
jgi:hypothetical protein